MSKNSTFFQDANDLNVDQMNINNDSGTRDDQSVTNVTSNVRGGGNTTNTHYDASRHNTTNIHYGDNHNTTNRNYGPINNYNAPVNNNYGAGSRFYATNAYHNSTVNNGDYYAPNAQRPAPPMGHRSQTTPPAPSSGSLRPAEWRSARQGSQNSYGPGASAPGSGQQPPPVPMTGQASPAGGSGKAAFNPWAKYYPKAGNTAQGNGPADQSASTTRTGQIPEEDDGDSDFVDTDSSASGGESTAKFHQRQTSSPSAKPGKTTVATTGVSGSGTTNQVTVSWSSWRDQKPEAKDESDTDGEASGMSGASAKGCKADKTSGTASKAT